MKQQSNQWECVSCLAVVAFHLRKCPQCGTNKEQFYVGMYQDFKTTFNSHFKKLGIIDFTLNQSGQVGEILELLVCYIEINEISHKILSSKQFIIKPYFIPLVQNEFQPITQEQADNGINFIEIFDYLRADIFIFESREKAFQFKQQCQQFHVQCPIKQFIEIGRIYPNTSASVNLNQMMKMLKIQFSSDCFALAEIVDELLARAYRFDTKMITTLENPIPEELNRLLGFDYIIILDFEATCNQNQNNKKSKEQQEIIEFPAQLYNVREKKIEQHFQYFVKPTNNPNLSEYCTSLTGITQEQVDQGINIEEAVDKFTQFTNGIERPCILTCGDFDLFQLKKEGQLKQFNIPEILKYYINIKKVFPKELNVKYPQELSMPEMLEALNMEHQGRLHSGIDDVKNITRIVDQLVQGGFRFDERMILYTFKI